MAKLFDKAISVGMGQCPVKRYNEYLRDLIITGHARPGKIVSHHIRIDQAPEAYKKFDQRTDGYTKVLIQFPEAGGLRPQVRDGYRPSPDAHGARPRRCLSVCNARTAGSRRAPTGPGGSLRGRHRS